MVRVICRIKPPLRDNTKIIDSSKLLFEKKDKDLKKEYKITSKIIKLDHFYGHNVKNDYIFRNEIESMLSESFYIFLYGHTGSGKTFTLFGNELNYGIIDYLFKKLRYKAKIECLELSNTGCIDLFTNKNVGLLEKNEVIQMFDLSSVEIDSFSKYSVTISQIKNKRKKGTSKHNSESSRTHLIINIYVDNKKYVIVDLAGNERKPEMKKGINYLDTSYINSSLLCLKECFRNSKKKNSFVPYRRSKLTRILRDVFETNVKSLIISTIHSGFDYQNDTNDTLFYISQFKNDLEIYNGKKKKFKSNKRPYADYRKKINLDKINIKSNNYKRPQSSPKYYKSNYFKENEKNSKLKPLNINNFTYQKNNHYKNKHKKNNNNYKNNNYKNNNYKNNNYKNKYKKDFKEDKLEKYKEDFKEDKLEKYKEEIKKLDEDIEKFNKKLNNNKKIYKYIDDYDYKNDKFYQKYDDDEICNYGDVFENDEDNIEINDSKNIYESKYDNYKIINLPIEKFYLEKYNEKESIRVFQAINQIMYTRSIKNYTTMAKSKDLNLDKIRSLCLSTMATIEVILSEIRKIK